MNGRVMRRSITSSCQSAATSNIVKARLVTSLTQVSSTIIASTLSLPFTFIGDEFHHDIVNTHDILSINSNTRKHSENNNLH